MANKPQLRKEFLAKRKSLSSETSQELSRSIQARFRDFFDQHLTQNVHVFLPIIKQNEIDTWPIINLLRDRQASIMVSKSDFSDHSLTHFRLEKGTRLEENQWGIPEPVDGVPIAPSEISMVLVPLLAFDERGYRVGYGKGFYDKFLAECKEDTLKVGLSLFPAVELIEADPHDIRLDYCLTPEAIYSFSA